MSDHDDNNCTDSKSESKYNDDVDQPSASDLGQEQQGEVTDDDDELLMGKDSKKKSSRPKAKGKRTTLKKRKAAKATPSKGEGDKASGSTEGSPSSSLLTRKTRADIASENEQSLSEQQEVSDERHKEMHSDISRGTAFKIKENSQAALRKVLPNMFADVKASMAEEKSLSANAGEAKDESKRAHVADWVDQKLGSPPRQGDRYSVCKTYEAEYDNVAAEYEAFLADDTETPAPATTAPKPGPLSNDPKGKEEARAEPQNSVPVQQPDTPLTVANTVNEIDMTEETDSVQAGSEASDRTVPMPFEEREIKA